MKPRNHVTIRDDGTRTINLRDAVIRQKATGKFDKLKLVTNRIFAIIRHSNDYANAISGKSKR